MNNRKSAAIGILIPLIYISAVTGLIYLFFRNWVYDDPFITYRYAANLAQGYGLVYNLGEKVLSTTSPLMAVLLALFHAAGAPIPATANLLGALSIAAGGWLLWKIASQLDNPAAGWAAALLYPTSALLISTLGSETPVYLALCLGAALYYLNDRHPVAAFLLGLAVLVRADALIFAGLLALDWCVRRLIETRNLRLLFRKIPWRAALIFIGVLLPWVLYGWLTYGSPLPATLAAKQAQALLDPGNGFFSGLLDLLGRLAGTPNNWIFLALIAFGMWIAFRTQSRWLPMLLWPAFYTAGYVILGVPRYPWYYAPLVPGLTAAAALALGTGFHDINRASGGETKTPLRPGKWLAVTATVLTIYLFGAQIADITRLHENFDERYPIYRTVGLWLDENTPEDARIGTLEVGIIGFFAQPRTMIDFTGLLQPEIAAQFAPGYGYADAALWAAERFEPDYFVLTVGHFQKLNDQYLSVHCSLAASFDGQDYGYSRNIVVYVCG